MNRDSYRLDFVLNVFTRLGYSSWRATENIALLNHPSISSEIIIDLNHPVLPSAVIEIKIKDAEIRPEFFDSMYNAEEQNHS